MTRFHVSALIFRNELNPSSPGAVDEDRGRAEPGPELLDRGVDRGPVGHVRGQADGRAAGGGDLGRRARGGVAVAVEDPDREAVGGEPLGDGEPDARAAPGDDGRALGPARRHWIGSSPANVVRCMSRGESGS